MDSGIGLLPAAAAVRRLRPDADLVLSSDPDGMPWGPRAPEDLTARALTVARAAAAHAPDALVVACNTASVHALPTLRAELEPRIPVIGTVPAIKPAAAAGGPVAIWATPATTGSPYQRRLIAEFGAGVDVTEVPCPGLAEAVQHADSAAVAAPSRRPPPSPRPRSSPSSSAAPTTNWSPKPSAGSCARVPAAGRPPRLRTRRRGAGAAPRHRHPGTLGPER